MTVISGKYYMIYPPKKNLNLALVKSVVQLLNRIAWYANTAELFTGGDMEITASRRKFNVTEKDRVLFNGKCYILLSQTYYEDWYHINPIISNTLFNKLIKEGKAVKTDEVYNSPFGIIIPNHVIYKFVDE